MTDDERKEKMDKAIIFFVEAMAVLVLAIAFCSVWWVVKSV